MKTSNLNTGKKSDHRPLRVIKSLLLILTLFTALPLLFGCAADHTPAPVKKLSDVLSPDGTLPHDGDAFTEGLFFDQGKLYESTGLSGRSKIRAKVDLKTGKAAAETSLPNGAFGEGACVMNGELYVLTYTEGKIFVFDPETLALKRTIDGYPREGWGLTTDGARLYAGDGSSHLYILDQNGKTARTIDVRDGGNAVENINELEWIDGKIWANIWMTTDIVIINPETGKVETRLDCGELKDSIPHQNTDDVLNGIAYDKENEKIYLTGKRWQSLFVFSRRK